MENNRNNKVVMNREGAAKFLSISVSFLDKLMAERKIPFSKINNKVLFLKEDLIKWVKNKRVVKPNNHEAK